MRVWKNLQESERDWTMLAGNCRKNRQEFVEKCSRTAKSFHNISRKFRRISKNLKES